MKGLYLIVGVLFLTVLQLNSQETFLIPDTKHLRGKLFEDTDNENYRVGSSNIKLNVMNYNSYSTIPIDYNFVTQQYIEKYLAYSWIKKVMGLGSFYFPLFETKFKRYGIPEELKYLAVVESNLNPRAVSHVGARGLWQFMPATGKEYGLGKNSLVNLFYDPVASTEASCRYLVRLYKLFGDWRLVLSAYNAGEGTVKRAIQKAGTKDYWMVRKYLPKETRAYVPSFFAVAYVFNFYKEYNIKPRNFALSYSNVLIWKANKHIDIDKLDNKEYFYFLNPQFTSGIIPEGSFYYSYNF